MKTIIAGSRDIADYNTVVKAVESSGIEVTEVVCGGARGVDMLGFQYAQDRGLNHKLFPADWNAYGRSAGYRRNEQMGDYAEALIAVWDGVSRGTKHMIDIATRKGLKVYVHEVLS